MKDSIKNLIYMIIITVIVLGIVKAFNFDEKTRTFINMFSIMILTFSFCIYGHKKRLKTDKKYKNEVNDERNLMIRFKASNSVYSVLVFILGLQSIYFLAMESYILAFYSIAVFVFSLVLMSALTKFYENRM